MQTQEFTVIGMLGLAILTSHSWPLFLQVFDLPVPSATALVLSCSAGLVLMLIDAVLIGIRRGRRK